MKLFNEKKYYSWFIAGLVFLSFLLWLTPVHIHAEDVMTSADGWKYSTEGSGSDVYAVIKGYQGTNWDLTIPSKIGNYNVQKIADYAFQGNNSVKSVIIPDSVTYIGRQAFMDCKYMTSATLGKGVSTVGMYAFAGTGISQFAFPDSVTSMGESILGGCTSLKKVTLPSKITAIPQLLCHNTRITEIRIPEGVKTIGSGAFSMCTSLEEVQLPKTLERIYASGFDGDYNLKLIYMYEGMDTIGQQAFRDCSDLEMITIPSTVRYIESEAFLGCTSLKTVVVKGTGSDPLMYSMCVGFNTKSAINPNMTIYCGPGSSSYTYANNNGIKTADLSAAPADPAENLSLDPPANSGTVVTPPKTTVQTTTQTASASSSQNYVPAKVKLTKAKAGKKKATVYFKRIAKNVTGYQVVLKKGKKTKQVTVKQTKKKTISKVIKKLKKGKWTVRVRAYNKINGRTYYGPWSAAKKIKVK